MVVVTGEEGSNNWIKKVNSGTVLHFLHFHVALMMDFHCDWIETVECMNTDAYWMWNDVDSDDIVFELDLFSSVDTGVSAARASLPLNEKRTGHGHDDVSWEMSMDIDRNAKNMPMDSAMIVLQLKDILIICLVIANVVTLTILAVMYCKRSSNGIEYKAVVIASDTENADLM